MLVKLTTDHFVNIKTSKNDAKEKERKPCE